MFITTLEKNPHEAPHYDKMLKVLPYTVDGVSSKVFCRACYAHKLSSI